MDGKNLTLLCDFYEYTMANGYLEAGMRDTIVYFDVFFRSVPDNGGFAIMAGLEQVIERIKAMSFDDSDIEFFRSKGIFREDFLEYLRGFRFTGDVWAIPEGTPIFPNEPIITVRATAPQAQMLETLMLLTINHQSLIATKANRIVRAASGRAVMEFGSRRAQGADAAILGARAAYIGGCSGTACTISDKEYGIPASGTMAHSWVQCFDSELEAFEAYCRLYPNNATLLVDTYDVLNSGIPNAIKAFKSVLWPMGIKKCAIRIDSGDLAFLTRRARAMLDEAGLQECAIVASNSLDEWIIRDLLDQGACIDAFGVGDNLITSHSTPVFGGVYKLAAVEDAEGNIVPKIKISSNNIKITTPGFKKVYRIYGADGKAVADLVALRDEEIDFSGPLTLFAPDARWKKKTIEHYRAEELMVPIFEEGALVYDMPTLEQIREHCRESVDNLWEEVKRFSNPHIYYVDLSDRLWDLRMSLLESHGFRHRTHPIPVRLLTDAIGTIRMTIRDEIIDALDGHGDTHPPAIFTQSGTVPQMEGCGAFWPEAHSDPEKMATLALQVSEKCGFGTVRIPFNITNDSVAFGGVERGLVKESQPTIGSSPYMSDGDFMDVPDDFISVDDFMANPRIQAMLAAADKLSKREDLFFTTSLNAPLAAINNILGIENVVMSLFMDPDKVTRWLTAVTPHISEYGKALSEKSDMVMFIEEADAEILPPDCFQMAVGDFLPKPIAAAKSYTSIHTCGTTTEIAKDLASLGETLLSPEASQDMAGYRALVGDTVKLAGAVNPVKTLYQGTPADIVAEAKASAAAGFDIITPECGVPPLTPNENLIALAKYREL